MNTKDLIEQINSADICSVHWLEDEIDMDGVTEIATIDRDERRWYVIGTVVLKALDGYVGVRGPVSLKSESMGFDDTGVTCEAFEMEQIPSVTYKRKS